MRRSTPYTLTGLSLVVGLVVLLFEPFAAPALNYLAGGALLAVAVAGVTAMITRYGGPEERGPDF